MDNNQNPQGFYNAPQNNRQPNYQYPNYQQPDYQQPPYTQPPYSPAPPQAPVEYEPVPLGKQKKPKKKRGCLFKLLRFLLILVAIIAVIIAAVFGWRKWQEHQKRTALEESLVTMSPEEYLDVEVLKETPSDIEGLSVYEKLEQGLAPYEGSDTDGDGLTDKEEIEVYGSDPLKASTSGDAIPDSIKVQKGLDINTVYTYAEAGYDPVAAFPEITLKDQTAENCLVSIYEIDGYKIEGVPVIKAIAIDNYNGKLTIDVSQYAEGADNLVAFRISDSVGAEYEQLNIRNNEISFDTKGQNYVVCLIDLDMNVSINNDFSENLSVNTLEGNEALIVTYPISLLSGSMKVSIVEKSELFGQGDSTVRAQAIQSYLEQQEGYDEVGSMLTIEHTYLDAVNFDILNGVLEFITGGELYSAMLEENGVEGAEIDSDVFASIMSVFVQYNHIGKTEWTSMLSTQLLADDKSGGGTDAPEKREKPSEYVSSFDVSIDAFPFQNLGTVYSTGGNCFGISTITAKLFNAPRSPDGEIRQKGIYSRIKEGVYDLSDAELDTLFDAGLYDYKELGYWSDTYGDTGTLLIDEYSDADAEFIKFLGVIHQGANNAADLMSCWLGEEPSWKAIESLKEYFASGDKIAIIAMTQPDSGHAVNAYGIEQDPDNPNVYYILVYDNNFPSDILAVNDLDMRIKVVKKVSFIGNETFTYEYAPLGKDSSYRFTSDLASTYKETAYSMSESFLRLLNAYSFSIYDENLGLIYD